MLRINKILPLYYAKTSKFARELKEYMWQNYSKTFTCGRHIRHWVLTLMIAKKAANLDKMN